MCCRCGNVAAILQLDENLDKKLRVFEAAPQVCERTLRVVLLFYVFCCFIAMPFGGRERAFNGLVESVIMFKLMDFRIVL